VTAAERHEKLAAMKREAGIGEESARKEAGTGPGAARREEMLRRPHFQIPIEVVPIARKIKPR